MAQIMWPQNGGSCELFCELSISTERLETGNRQGTWKHTHVLRSARTETPEPLQWWVNGLLFSGDKSKKMRDVCFFPTHNQKTGSKGEGGAPVISTSGCECKAAQHPPWRRHLPADADIIVLHWCVSLYACYLCMHILYIFLENIIMAVISIPHESPLLPPPPRTNCCC